MKNIFKSIYRILFFLLVVSIFSACEDNETFEVPTADFELTGTLRAFDTVTFVNNSKNATSFLWHFGNGETVYAREPKYIYTEAGTYSVTLQAEGTGGRTVLTREITIAAGVPLPTASFQIENTGVLFEGAPIVFINESEFGSSYLWEFGDEENSTSTEKDPIFAYNTPGEYTVKLTTTNEKGNATYQMPLTILQGNLGYVYFIHNGDNYYVKKVNVRTKEVSNVTEIPGFGFGIEYDPFTEKIYYADDDNQIIYSNNLGGTDEQEIASDFSSIHDLALDRENGYLYVTDRSASALVEIRLSDLRKTTLYSEDDDGLGALPEGVAYAGDQLYITCVDIDAESVWKGNVFGDGVSRIIDYNAGGYGYGIAVDAANSKIYFDDNDSGNIRRANLDGTEVENIVATTDRVYGIEIDEEFGRLYWSDRSGNIYVSSLDGSNLETLVSGLGDIRGIVLIK
ncbi:MAG: PKD domain-containing protein [Cyclobacteriaceae bacterium]